MFTNLIESTSHAQDLKRRGSFVLFTTVTYFLLFAIAGVASIYAYDARLEDQTLEEVVMLSPVDLPAPPAPAHATTPPKAQSLTNEAPQRAVRMASVDTPQVVPERTSATPNKNLPVPPSGNYLVTGRDVDPIGPPSGSGNGGVAVAGTGSMPAIEVGTPPPAPPVVERPKPQMIHKSVLLNGEALSLPKPPYPPLAKQLHIQGSVNVQVVISETGKVISAKAVSGNASLTAAAQQAAMQARFSPTVLGEQPVKVSGIITYNFVLQ
ncbi:MAG TPA: TonB family protein [Pyrinomonadaceae bacterium]|jgi:protein TonB|nr:TonB family protein [Pyrinomonadaceae bacterium]